MEEVTGSNPVRSTRQDSYWTGFCYDIPVEEEKYNHKTVEPKWQRYWEQEKIFRAEAGSKHPKFYILDMFAYPSGEGLHVGHPRGYTASDILAKYYKMKGNNVLHPFGWDAFGLPAENYAIKVGIHPKETTEKNIQRFKDQLTSFGFGYDWIREIDTSKPEYYKWTQWVFKILYDNGLAYKKEAYANWCPECQTVLANEQVVAGRCERCDSLVEQKKLKQWFFKITDFAEELIERLDRLDWPQSSKEMQRNWIGRSEGAEIEFEVVGHKEKIKVFTTRADTLFGATYVVLAPEHELVERLTTPEQKAAVEKYIAQTKLKTTLDRTMAKEKTGVFIGSFAVNPATKKEIPIWVADYALMDYGTGAIMAVPAHDSRDFVFAKKFELPIVEVISIPKKLHRSIEMVSVAPLIYDGHGKLINSGEFNGQDSAKVALAIAEKFGGKTAVQYKLHDWLISRQRYWGAPIPIVYGEDGKPVSVDEKDLPVVLPEDVDFKPHGKSPLAASKAFQRGVEEKYGKGTKREIDTMDTFVCSSWYFLRYCDPNNAKEFAGKESLKYWMPVDFYIGGAEHVNGHLLYSRFIVKALHKLGFLDFDEPFLKLRHQGMILGEDGEKMSKSRGNVVNPDDVIEKYGADTMRMYEMFIGPFALSMPWSTQGAVGVRRFLDRVWQVVESSLGKPRYKPDFKTHGLVKKVTTDLENEKFNTAISAMMEFVNDMSKEKDYDWTHELILLLSPFAPHLAEEVWQNIWGNKKSIFDSSWPKFNPQKAVTSTVTMVVAENGKKRGTLELPAGSDEAMVLRALSKDEKLSKIVADSKRHIFVPDRMINFI